MEDRILIRYGELALKKANLRQFVNQINNHIKRALKSFKELTFEARGLRFYILLNGVDATRVGDVLKKIPGIYSFSLVTHVSETIDDIKKCAVELVQKEVDSGKRSFKVETRRGDKEFPLDSLAITKCVAGCIFSNVQNIKADMYKPDFTLNIDVRLEGAFLFTNTTLGLGGLPASSLGKGMLLISGGIDSVVAGYLAIRRGLGVEAIHFAAPPYTSDNSVQKVVDLLEKLCPYTEFGSINLYVVPFTKIQKQIYDTVKEDYCITIIRRMMYRIASMFAKTKNSLCLLNGENIGQVASQTLESIETIESVATLPVIRPLACFDKQDIIDISLKIGTYDISIRPFDDCCTVFVPKHPQIRPRIDHCEAEEAKANYEDLIKEALDNTPRIILKQNRHYNYLTKSIDSFDELL